MLLKHAGNTLSIQACITSGRNPLIPSEMDCLKPHYRRMEPGVRKLMKENEKLKTLLAEKDLENALLSESIKKKTVKR